MFLHFAIETKNKEQIHNFSESSKSRMQRFASRSLATPAIYSLSGTFLENKL